MLNFRGTAFVGFVLGSAILVACSSDAADALTGNGTTESNATSSGGAGGASSSSGGAAGSSVPQEEQLFRALAPDMEKKCGGACHTDATYQPTPPAFLAGPDAYKTIKSQPGLITRDVYQSALLTKGSHAGPAVSSDADFEKKVTDWLTAESLAIQSLKLPTTDAFTVKNGANDVDLTPVCIGGLTGVHLTFNASLVGGMLSLANVKIVAPAGTDVHMLKPKFYKVLATPKPDGTKEIADPADSFSNTDVTVPGGQTSALPPGSVFFTGGGWMPFDLAGDKIRIEAQKLEPGKVQVVQAAPTCKNPTLFASAILPQLKGGGGVSLNCAGCHGNGLANLALNGTDNAAICQQVLAKLNQANLGQSLIVTKVTVGPHNGGLVANTAQWQQLWTTNSAAFF